MIPAHSQCYGSALGVVLSFPGEAQQRECQRDALKNTATKEDLSQLRDEMKSGMIAMEASLIETMRQLIQQKPNA